MILTRESASRFLFSLIALLFVLGFFYQNQLNKEKLAKQGRLGGDFTLISAEGPRSLHEFRGGLVLIYFGYATCPDVCPTSLAVIKQAFAMMNSTERDQVDAIFISVDPDRDSPEMLKTYSEFFSPKILGLTGSREEIDAVVRDYGVFYRMVELKDSALGYAVDHSSRIYLVDQNGKLVGSIPHSKGPGELVKHIRRLL